MDGTILSVHEGPHAGDLHHDSAPNPLGVDGSRVDKPAHCTDADATKLSSGLLESCRVEETLSLLPERPKRRHSVVDLGNR